MKKVAAGRVSELGGNGLLEWVLRTDSQTGSRASSFLQYLLFTLYWCIGDLSWNLHIPSGIDSRCRAFKVI